MVLMKAKKILWDPVFENNPIALQVLGICSALAVTVQLKTTLVMCAAVIFVLAVSTAGSAEKILDTKDPGCIVIDEIIGMLIALFALPFTPLIFIAGFFLTRGLTAASSFQGPGANEILLIFSLVFTFAVGLEVIK